MDNLIGKDVGRFHIEEQLGEGGMATVYKAFDTDLERVVAIKFIRSEIFSQETAIPRFKREAQALAKLNHPSINRVLDYAWHEDSPYFIMEYLPGGNLKQMIGEPIEWKKASEIVLQIGKALAYAHDHNIIHRDIKPANILISQDGSPVISDFGIAKLLEQESGSYLTMSGAIVGTPAYMSPEQGQGETADRRSDIYSLGVVYYELLTGRTPFQADTPVAVIIKQINNPLPSPRKLVPEIDERVEQILFKALAKDPQNRFSSMNDFNRAIDEVLSGKETTEKGDSERPVFRGKWARVMGLVLISAIVITSIIMSLNGSDPKPSSEEYVQPSQTTLPTPIPTEGSNTIEATVVDQPTPIPPTAAASNEPTPLVFEPFVVGKIYRHVLMNNLGFIQNGDWTSNDGQLDLQDNSLRLHPESSEVGGMLWDLSGNSVGNAGLIRFRVLNDSEISFEYADIDDEMDTENYRAIWINQWLDNRNPGRSLYVHWSSWDGTSQDLNLINPEIQLSGDILYNLLIRISVDGELTIMLWEEGSSELLWSLEVPMGESWANQSYRMLIHSVSGAIDLVEYYELTLD